MASLEDLGSESGSRGISCLKLIFTSILWFMITLAGPLQAQSEKPQWWYTYNHTGRVFDRWGYGFDLNHRSRGVVPFNSTLSAARMGVNYHTKTGFTVTAGYAWFGTYINDFDRIWLHENRAYQQVQFLHGHVKLGFMHRIRIEQRFREVITDRENFDTEEFLTNRYRYMIQLGGLITTTPKWNIQLRWQAANEIMIHNVEEVGTTLFDQNRTLAGIVILPKGNLSIAFLYQFIVQQQPLLREIQYINSFRLTFIHQFDFRNQNKGVSYAVPDID